MVKLIDVHRHLWDHDWFPPGHRMMFATRAAYRRLPFRDPMDILPRVGQAPGTYDPEGTDMIRDMDELGIDVSVIMAMDWGMRYVVNGEPDSPMHIREINQRISEVTKKYPGRAHFFCGVDPRRHDALEIFETAVKEWGAVGYKPYPPNGYYANDPLLIPIYRKCIEFDVPVLIHTGGAGSTSLSKYTIPEPVEEIAVRFPDLKVIMGHTNITGRWEGGSYWRGIQLAGPVHNIYLDLTEWQATGALDDYNINSFWHVMDVMRNSVGAHRILFGTDMPAGRGRGFETTRRWCNIFKNLPEEAAKFNVTFTPEETELMCHANTERLLKI